MKNKNKVNEQELEEVGKEVELPQNDSTDTMGPKLKALLADDIKDAKKKKKSRLGEMIAIFAAHNFYASGITPEELRTTLEDLGPTYVKIGQIMSSRPDMLPDNYCKELEKLRQTVRPIEGAIVRAIIEDETGKDIDEIYSEFQDKPLGSASIGQAHYGVLKDGTKVVTKVQRPLIEDLMVRDFALLKKLAGIVNVVTTKDGGDPVLDLVTIIEELEKVSMQELDFRIEAGNTKFFKENCIEDEAQISCPTVIDELTTKRIFTMTYVDGCSVAHKDQLVAQNLDLTQIGTAIVTNFVHQILDVGSFHADPHQGNIMVSEGKPFWIDFGMIGHVSKREMDLIQSLLLSIINHDTEQCTNVVMSLGIPTSQTNRNAVTQDVGIFLDRFGAASNIMEMDISSLFGDVIDLAGKHNIKLPGSFTMLVRSVIALEGVLEQLCPDINLMEIISNKLIDNMKKSLDLKQKILDIGKDILGAGKKSVEIPGLVVETLNGINKGRTKVNLSLSDTEEPMYQMKVFIKDIVLAVIACVMFIGGCILCSVNVQPITSLGVPLIAVIFMVFSCALGIYAVKNMVKKKKKKKK